MSTYNKLANIQAMIKDNKNTREAGKPFDRNESSRSRSDMSSLSSSSRHRRSIHHNDDCNGGGGGGVKPPSYPPAMVETIAAPQALLASASDHQEHEYTNTIQYSSDASSVESAPATGPPAVALMALPSSHSPSSVGDHWQEQQQQAFATHQDSGAMNNGGPSWGEGGRHTGADHHQGSGRRNSRSSQGSGRRNSLSLNNSHHYKPSYNDDLSHHGHHHHLTASPPISHQGGDRLNNNRIDDLLTLDMRSYHKLEDAIVEVKLFLEVVRHDAALDTHRRLAIAGGMGVYVTIIMGDGGINSPGTIFRDILQQIFRNQKINFIDSEDGESLQVDALSGIRTDDNAHNDHHHHREEEDDDDEEDNYRPSSPLPPPNHNNNNYAQGNLSGSVARPTAVIADSPAVSPLTNRAQAVGRGKGPFLREDIPNGNARLLALSPSLFDGGNNNHQTIREEEGFNFHHASLPLMKPPGDNCEPMSSSSQPMMMSAHAAAAHTRLDQHPMSGSSFHHHNHHLPMNAASLHNRVPHPREQTYPQDPGAGMLYDPIAHALLRCNASGNSSESANSDMFYNALSDCRVGVPPQNDNIAAPRSSQPYNASPLSLTAHLNQQHHEPLEQHASLLPQEYPLSPVDAALRAALLAQAQSTGSLSVFNGYVPRVGNASTSHHTSSNVHGRGSNGNMSPPFRSPPFRTLPPQRDTSSSSSRRNISPPSSRSTGETYTAPTAIAAADSPVVERYHSQLSRRGNCNNGGDPQDIRQAIRASQAAHIAHTRQQVAEDIQFRRALEQASNTSVADAQQQQQQQQSSSEDNSINEEGDLIKMASRRSILDEQQRQNSAEERDRAELELILEQSERVHTLEQKEVQRFIKSEEELMAEVMVKSRVEEEEYLQNEEELLQQALVKSLAENANVDENELMAEVMRKSLSDSCKSGDEETEEVLEGVLKMSLEEKKKSDEEEEQLRKAMEW
eukprot:CAMPEP_0172299746 /NCGR_PEP_ID=MMETSP1058-20130122/1981_1 /TAXON_ID=83371 /ORGANISM="Detonula confervacea, Strain CCMP 353" /LENGTH=962 /DNA_ID=CAMNT_0013009301 /DNA_START=12 /DNA_END=2897 /DNA_ORIENTATION=-